MTQLSKIATLQFTALQSATLLFTILFVALFASSASAQSLRKLLENPQNVIESKWERNEQGDTELNYYNEDYCDYYLYRANDRSYNLNSGKNTIFKIEKGSQVDNPFKSSSSYRFYRGKFPKDFQINTPYALPVKDGEKTEWRTDPREPFKTMNFHLKEGDIVYATRSGVACETAHSRHLLIYHPDHTFAAYLVMKDIFVKPGETITTGQPVGIAGPTGVSITFFFLDENKFSGFDASGYPYSHFIPIFRTSEGDVKPEEKKFYQAKNDDELMMQDMTKREKKKYLKQKDSK